MSMTQNKFITLSDANAQYTRNGPWNSSSFRPWIGLIWQISARRDRQNGGFFGARLFWNYTHTNSVLRSIYGLFCKTYGHWAPIIGCRLIDYGHWGPIISCRLTAYGYRASIIGCRFTYYGHWGPHKVFPQKSEAKWHNYEIYFPGKWAMGQK